HQADPEQGGDVWRLRYAAEGGGPRHAWARAVPDRDRRRRAGGECRGRQGGRPHARWPDIGKDLPRRDQGMEYAGLRKLNPNLKLPSQPIAVVHRSDGSGTTFVFTNYLSKMSADWRSKVGSITAVDWPVGAGARGNEGVAAMVARIKGAIGYVEYTY